MTLSLEPVTKAVDKTQYSWLMEIAATMKLIESCIDHGMDDEEIGKTVLHIINESR